MTKRAWYIGCTEAEVGQRAILVGDPARINRLATLLDDVHWIPENRMLRTVTGTFQGQRITASAFGMGAPIAAIVLHELASLGVRVFLRIGTAMALPPVMLGDYLVGVEALCHEGTSPAYGGGPVIAADEQLCGSLESVLGAAGASWRKGRFASFDGFYRDMFALEPATEERVQQIRDEMLAEHVLATDMESSAIFTVARSLGAKAGSLCIATVDSVTQRKLEGEPMQQHEAQLFRFALEAVARTPVA